MIIDEFMSRYEREYDYYQEAARICQTYCETQLAQKGIRAIVTSRAKRPDRLRQKIKQRISEKNYSCVNDIYEDIVDLAGVRIALYFPGDHEEVDKLIKAEFIVKKSKSFPDPDKKDFTYEKRFSGYKARHYHVYLEDEHLIEERYSKACIEIQVASVLMHAWAEVEHDLLYKPLSGELSDDEHATLDAINGLVLTGEIVLERLQKAQERRIGKKGSHFNDQYELASFLYNHLRTKTPTSTMIMGQADVLFYFLQLAKLDRPEKLTTFISDIDTTENQRTISDQLIDHILSAKPELYNEFEKALLMTNVRQFNSSVEHALGYFLRRWSALESFMEIALKHQGYNFHSVTSSVLQSLLFGSSHENFQVYNRLHYLRNALVHKGKIPEYHVLLEESVAIEDLLNILYNASSEEIRKEAHKSEEIRKLIRGEK